MPRNGAGAYSLPAGNPVVTGAAISSTWANTSFADFVVQFNNVLTKDGVVGPSAPQKFQDGTVSAPGITFASATNTGFYRTATILGLSWAGILRASVDEAGAAINGTLAVSGAVSLTTKLAVSEGGTGSSTAANARTALGAAASGPIGASGITGAAIAGPLGASGITGAAVSGANNDITALTALATPLTALQGGAQIQPVTASIAANALSVFLDPTQLDFRSSALGAAAINRRTVGSQISVVVSSGSTLGTFNGVKNRLVVLAIDNAGTVELAVCNIAYNSALDETQTISTVAEGGAGGADSANVVYSTTARSGVPFRIVGYIESTQATAGTWATAPSLVQGAGGNAARQHMSVGYHQAWTGVTRTVGTTYYNDTGKPIIMNVHGTPDTSNAYIIATVGGVTVGGDAAASSAYAAMQIMIPPGQTYLWTMSAGTLTNITVRELR